MNTQEKLFDDFYLNNFTKVCQYVYRMIGSMESAEDLVQEAYIVALNKNVLQFHQNPPAWLYVAVRYNIKMYYRAHSKIPDKLPLDDSISFFDENFELSELLESLKTLLSKEEYYLAYKIYILGFSEPEMAKELNVSENAIRLRVHKIKKKIMNGGSTFYAIVIFVLFR